MGGGDEGWLREHVGWRWLPKAGKYIAIASNGDDKVLARFQEAMQSGASWSVKALSVRTECRKLQLGVRSSVDWKIGISYA